MADKTQNCNLKLGTEPEEIINKISKRLAEDLSIVDIQRSKNRPRSREVIIVKGDNGQYFIELANNSVQKFYLKRSIHFLNFFKKKIRYASINLPVFIDEIDGFYVVVFPYLLQRPSKPDFSGEKILQALSKDHTYTTKITPEVLNKIENGFISSWPDEYHFFIQNLPEYSEYLEQLKLYDKITLCPEHGDFALNNILRGVHSKHLIDFEFSRENQPVGFDLYKYRRTAYKIKLFWKNKIPYENLHKLKYSLCDEISFAQDNDLSEVIIYPALSLHLRNIARKVLNHCPDSPETHSIKSFLSKPYLASSLFFVTIWNKNRISGFAAFKNRHNILYPVKTMDKVPVVCFVRPYQFALFIKYLDRKGLGFNLTNIPKRSALYQQFTRLKESLQTAITLTEMTSAKKDKSEDSNLFPLLRKISGTLESAREKVHGDFVSISNNRNREIKLKYLRNRFSRIPRHVCRFLKAETIILSNKINAKRLVFSLYHYLVIRSRWGKSHKKGGTV